MKKNIYRFIVSLTLLALVATLSAAIDPDVSSAQSEFGGLKGYAWSAFFDTPLSAQEGDNRGGIGWLSFSSSDQSSSANYGVSLNPFTGALSGSAWTSNYGWLSFDRAVTGNPPGPISDDPGRGSGPIAMKVGDRITGWARFIAACHDDLWDARSKKCTGVGAGNANGIMSGTDTVGQYWDGWVSLNKNSRDTIDYGLMVDPVTFQIDGFAWGGPTNVGWIAFHQDGIDYNPVPVPVDPTNSPPDINVSPEPPYDPAPDPTPPPVPPCENCTGVTIGGNPFVAMCSVTPTSGIISKNNPKVAASWSASVVGGKSPHTMQWIGTGSGVDGLTSTSATVEYVSAGAKTASARFTDADGKITSSDACSILITSDVVNPPTACTVPSNATLCSGSANNQGGVSGSASDRLHDNGSCPSTETEEVGACVFQCNADYVRRGASCIRKSSVIEQ